MQKIIFLIPNLMHGGAEKVLVNLVNNLDQEKYAITLYSIFDQGVNKQFLKPHIRYQSKFQKVFRGNSHLMKLFSPQFLYRFFIKEEYDMVIAFLEGPAARIISGCPHPKTKKIAWIHVELNDKDTAKVGFRSIEKAVKAYQKFDQIIAVSETVGQFFKQNITDKVPLKVLYNVNETHLIRKLSEEPAEIEFSMNTINICSVAKLVSTKGYDRLIEIHRRLLDEGLDHCINIIGIGEEKDKLERLVKELGISSSFRFLGFHKNPYKLIKQNDLYVCSSRREGFSTAVSEALILGLPVVSTNCSGAYELLGHHNEYGIVTENNTESLYRGLKDLLAHPEKLQFYKSQAELRGNFFSTDNTVKAVEQFLDSVV